MGAKHAHGRLLPRYGATSYPGLYLLRHGWRGHPLSCSRPASSYPHGGGFTGGAGPWRYWSPHWHGNQQRHGPGPALPYAAVAVLTDAGTLAAGSVCGAQGQFGLPGLAPGVYTLRISSLGYQDLVRPGLVVPAAGSTVALGTLPLVPAAQQLGEVAVMARRPLLEENRYAARIQPVSQNLTALGAQREPAAQARQRQRAVPGL